MAAEFERRKEDPDSLPLAQCKEGDHVFLKALTSFEGLFTEKHPPVFVLTNEKLNEKTILVCISSGQIQARTTDIPVVKLKVTSEEIKKSEPVALEKLNAGDSFRLNNEQFLLTNKPVKDNSFAVVGNHGKVMTLDGAHEVKPVTLKHTLDLPPASANASPPPLDGSEV